MRFLDRSSVKLPESLLTEDVISARRDVDNYLRQDAKYASQRRAPVDPKLWSQSDVVEALHGLSHGKCHFCETISVTKELHSVHHFRPVSVETKDDGFAQYYAWFAYEWRNLHLICQDCARQRRSAFPVNGRRAPIFCTIDEAREVEDARLIDPSHEDPRRHFKFYGDGSVRGGTYKGDSAISYYGLDRPQLVEERAREFRSIIEIILSASANGLVDAGRIRDVLEASRPYSGAIEIYLRGVFSIAARDSGVGVLSKSGDFASVFIERIDDVDKSALSDAIERMSTQREAYESVRKYESAREVIPVRYTEPKINKVGTLKHIRIQNCKGIEDLDFDMPESRPDVPGASGMVLLGENSTGKSTVLQAIALSLIGAEHAKSLVTAPSDYLRRKDRERWALFDAEEMRIETDVFGGKLTPFWLNQYRQEFEGSGSQEVLVLGYGPRRYFSKEKRVKRSTPATRVASLFSSEATLAHPGPWLNSLKDYQFDAVARGLREILALNPEDDLLNDPSMGVCVRAFGQLIPINRMSEGYKSIFAMSVDIMRELMSEWSGLEEARGIVLIDEIETHLHPRWKMQVLSALRKAMPRVQFIVTTHDPLCLRGSDDSEVKVLRRDADQRIEVLKDLPSIKGMRADQILTSEYFGLSSTVDIDLERKIQEYSNLIGIPEAQRTSRDSHRIKELQSQMTGTIAFGDTAAQQIIQEAVSLYLAERKSLSEARASERRKETVMSVLAALRGEGVAQV